MSPQSRGASAALVALMVWALEARAAESPGVVVSDDAPFSREELARSLEIRAAELACEHALEARASGADAIEIVCGSKRRVVALLGARGAPAARKVAIAIADLLEAELDLAPAALPRPPEPAPVIVQPEVDRSPRTAVVAAPRDPEPTPEPSRVRPYSIGARLFGAGGDTLSRPVLGATLEATIGVDDARSALFSAGASWSAAESAGDAEISASAFPLRAGIAHRFAFAPLEVRATLNLAVLAISGDDGTTTPSTTLFDYGAGTALTYALPIARAFDLVVAAGADVSATNVRILARGRTALTTDRVTFWAGTGITFGGTP